MQNLPLYISLLFVLTTVLTILWFYKAAHLSGLSLLLMLVWLGVMSVLSLNGFFTVTETLPPRAILLVAPPLLLIVLMFVTERGRQWVDRLDLKTLTLLHVVRIPVELVLLLLSLHKVVPQLMTFEGRNLDIFSGVTAPVIYYFGFVKKQLNRRIILWWNIVCLLLLVNIVVHAVLSIPSPFQQLAFEQPNIAVLHFPYVWLPGCVVPIVLFCHLVSLRRLLMNRTP